MRLELKRVAAMLSRLSHKEDGVTAIEYGLLAALIAVVCIVAFNATGTSLSAIFEYWSGEVIRAFNGAP
jgi:pilus assembly protein Flp/PilA